MITAVVNIFSQSLNDEKGKFCLAADKLVGFFFEETCKVKIR